MRGKPFAKGGDPRIAKGGAREGAGRPAEWLKAKCREIVDKNELIKFLGDVAKGNKIETVVTDTGIAVKVPAGVKSRISATTELLDRGYGKPNMTIEVNGNYAAVLIAEIMKSLRVIPTVCPHCKTNTRIKEAVGEHLLELSRRFESGELVA